MPKNITSYQDSIRLEKSLIHLFFDRTLSAFPMVLIYPAVVAILFWGMLNTTVLLLWLGFGFILDILRYWMLKMGYYATIIKAGAPIKTYDKWLRFSYVFYILTGLRWAFAGFEFFSPEALFSVGMMYAVLFGIVSGAVFIMSTVPRAFYLFTIPIIVSVAARVLISADTVLLIVSFTIATLLFYANNIKMMLGLRKKESVELQLQIENEHLIDKLEIEKKAAEKANIKKSSFLAAASHDLRQPVQSLVLLSDALQHISKDTKDKDSEDIASKITHSTENLSLLLENLLDISRLDAGAMTYNISVVSLEMVLLQVYESFELQAKDSEISLEKQTVDIFVETDFGLLMRLLSNLVDNALKYTKEGSVSILVEEKDTTVEVSVIDTGIGIAEHHQEVIFEEFKQLNNQERNRAKGLGLGLSICSKISSILGHSLYLESTLGVGTKVTVILNKSEMTITKAEEKLTASLDGKVALVVDNELEICDALRLSLESVGAQVFDASDLESALFLAENLQSGLDFIVCDYRLEGDITGVAVIKEIRKIYPDVAAVLLTGDVERKNKEDGSYTTLLKPVTTKVLASTVEELLV